MKKVIYTLSILLLFSITTLLAQERLKGNKEVTTEIRNISDFNKIEVIDNVEVLLVYNPNQSIEIETDSNLHKAILTEINDGVLTIKTIDKIARKKKLIITVKVNHKLNSLASYNNAKISSRNLLQIDSLSIVAFDNSDIDLKLHTEYIHITGKKNSNLNFEVLTTNCHILTELASEIKAIVDSKNSYIQSLDRSTITMSGTTDILEIEASGNSKFKGKGFVISDALVHASNNSNVLVNVTKYLDIYATNASEVSIYSNPEIKLSEFFDKASIHKRE